MRVLRYPTRPHVRLSKSNNSCNICQIKKVVRYALLHDTTNHPTKYERITPSFRANADTRKCSIKIHHNSQNPITRPLFNESKWRFSMLIYILQTILPNMNEICQAVSKQQSAPMQTSINTETTKIWRSQLGLQCMEIFTDVDFEDDRQWIQNCYFLWILLTELKYTCFW